MKNYKATALLVASLGLAFPTPAAADVESHLSCACGYANVVTVNGSQAKTVVLATIPSGHVGHAEVDAVGYVKFADSAWWRDLYDVVSGFVQAGKIVWDVGSTFQPQLEVACPACDTAFGAAESTRGTVDKFLGKQGKSKTSGPLGRDPERLKNGDQPGYGSKKGGGLLLVLPGGRLKQKNCPCQHDPKVVHLVKDGPIRFGKYAKEHRYLTPSQLAKKTLEPGELRAILWDKNCAPGDMKDNQGEFVVTCRLKTKKR